MTEPRDEFRELYLAARRLMIRELVEGGFRRCKASQLIDDRIEAERRASRQSGE